MITFEDIVKNQEIKTYIEIADESLTALGYTEHSFTHVVKCAKLAGEILKDLGYSQDKVRLGMIAGYMHDIGNMINRSGHAHTGAVIAFNILTRLNMPPLEIGLITTAIGNHDEETAYPINEIAAALILADKCDVRRTRVRNTDNIKFDIHDRVNYAVIKSDLVLDRENKTITLFISLDDTISKVSDYFEIFMERMLLCKKASKYFDLTFQLNINDIQLM